MSDLFRAAWSTTWQPGGRPGRQERGNLVAPFCAAGDNHARQLGADLPGAGRDALGGWSQIEMIGGEVEEETTSVTCRVVEIDPVRGDKLIALAAVEIEIAGVVLTLHGVQVQRGQQGGAEATAVTLPRYRTAAGDWRSAITLPEELRRPIADAVLVECLELGLVRDRFG